MDDLVGCRVFVTGADGLVGNAVARVLSEKGAIVTSVGKGTGLPGAATAIDLARTEWPVAGHDAIVHCAARVPTRFQGAEADQADEENRSMDARAVEAASVHKLHLVYFSSGSVYGDTVGLIDDETPARPCLSYAAQKLATEANIEAQGLSATVFRLIAPYGPRQRRRTVIKTFLDAAFDGKPLRYYGSGDRTQDFIHVDDIAGAVESAIVRRACGRFVLASGVPVTMRDLAALVVNVTGSASVVQAAGIPDPEEGRKVRYDVARVRDELALPVSRDLKDGLSAWACLRRQLSGPAEAA